MYNTNKKLLVSVLGFIVNIANSDEFRTSHRKMCAYVWHPIFTESLFILLLIERELLCLLLYSENRKR